MLGWDTGNTQMVEVERTYSKWRADYLLKGAELKEGAKPETGLVEAKCLGEPNRESVAIVDQVLPYALHFEAKSVIITNTCVGFGCVKLSVKRTKQTELRRWSNRL